MLEFKTTQELKPNPKLLELIKDFTYKTKKGKVKVLLNTNFATRFAAKEAVVKALGTGFSNGIWVRDIEVVRDKKGKPSVVLSGRAKEVAEEQGVREIQISLSYTHTEAVACALAITESSVQSAEERKDPMEELAKQFKETRGMLDEL